MTTTESGFQLSGNAPEHYERFMAPIMAPFVEAVVAYAELKPNGSCLDVACGTGFVARKAAAIVGPDGRVAGLDLNAGMLAIARTIAGGLSPTIEWYEASALSMPFDDDEFDAIVCQQGIQFFPDLNSGVSEMRRVAIPGACVVASFFTPSERRPYVAALATRVGARLGDSVTALIRQAGSLEPNRAETAFQLAGLDDVQVDEVAAEVTLPPVATYFPAQVTSSVYAAEFAALPAGESEAITAEIEEDLAVYQQPDGSIRVPFSSYVITGRK